MVIDPLSGNGLLAGLPAAGQGLTGDEQRRDVAYKHLDAIGEALHEFADDHGGFPEFLSAGLNELEPYGNMSKHLAVFEDDELTIYERTLSADLRQDEVYLEAVPRGLDETIELNEVYDRH